jgi:hypothetical protein
VRKIWRKRLLAAASMTGMTGMAVTAPAVTLIVTVGVAVRVLLAETVRVAVRELVGVRV